MDMYIYQVPDSFEIMTVDRFLPTKLGEMEEFNFFLVVHHY